MDAVIEQPRPLPVDAPADAIPAAPGRRSYAPWIVLLLTLAGGIFRFATIDRPPMWNDDAHTFRRITGSFQQLLNILESDGFAPLHYESYWWIAQKLGGALHMSPFWMRFIPALCGTAMIPAMYFLARQLCSRRTSLVVAAFTACSAYMNNYSHDAKMYMQLWLFIALSVACFLCWLRTGVRIAWLGWIASGCAAGGFHATGLLPLAIAPLILLTQRRLHWVKVVLFTIGAAIIISGPAGYYLHFNQWKKGEGLQWVRQYNRGRDGGQLVLYATSAYLYSWEWPHQYQLVNDDKFDQNSEEMYSGMQQGFNIDPRVCAALMAAVIAIIWAAALGMLPWSPRLRGERLHDPQTESGWRKALWLGAWIVIPAYGFYCEMVYQHVTPNYWIESAKWYLNNRQLLLVLVTVLLSALFLFSRYIPLGVSLMLGMIFLASIFVSLLQTRQSMPEGEPWWALLINFAADWTTRMTPQPLEDGSGVAIPGVFLIALMTLPALCWYYCGKTIGQRFLKTAAFLAVTWFILTVCQKVGEHFLANENYQDFGAAWMPRYVAIIWPAFAIAICALIMRLPTLPLRALAVILLLGVNVAQTYARHFAGSDPPVDRMAADVWDANIPGSTTRVFIARGPQNAHPAGGTIDNRPGKYYLSVDPRNTPGSVMNGQPFTNSEFMGGGSIYNRFTIGYETEPYYVRSAARDPSVNRIVVWERLTDQELAQETDPLLQELGSGWKLNQSDLTPVRFHWNWSHLYTTRRREYVKTPPVSPP